MPGLWFAWLCFEPLHDPTVGWALGRRGEGGGQTWEGQGGDGTAGGRQLLASEMTPSGLEVKRCACPRLSEMWRAPRPWPA